MNFELTPEQKMFRDMARKFAEQEILPELKEYERQRQFNRSIIKKMAALGLLAPHLPQKYGGLGLDYVTTAIIWEQLCWASIAVTQAANSSCVQPGGIILAAGTEEQKQKWLPAMCRGDLIVAGAAVEPNAGSDASAIETTALPSGDHWIINGAKNFITNGDIAHIVLVLAQTDKSKGPRGISFFAVETNTSGFSSLDIPGMISWLGGSIANLRFTDCQVPQENQVGEIGRGLRNAMAGIDTARLELAAGGLGMAQSCLEASIKYTKQRVQFGKPIASFQLVQAAIADLAAHIESVRWLVYYVADLKSKGLPHIKEMSYAKYLATELALQASGIAIKLHGAYGCTDDYPVGHHYRDAIATTILGGTKEMHLLTIGRQLLDIDAIS